MQRGGPQGDHGRGLDEHGAPLARHEGAGLAAPALGARDHRRDGAGDACRTSTTPWAGLRRRLRPHPRHDGEGDRRLRGLQPARPRSRSASGIRAAGPRARLPHAVRAAPSSRTRRCPTSCPPDGPPDAGDDALARPVEHHDLLEQRPLPRREEPAHARLHEPRRHGASAASREFDLVDITSFARDGSTPLGLRLPRARLRHPARQRRRATCPS